MKIELYGSGGRWVIFILAANNKLLFTSQSTYKSRRNAMTAAKLLKAQLGKAKIVDAA